MSFWEAFRHLLRYSSRNVGLVSPAKNSLKDDVDKNHNFLNTIFLRFSLKITQADTFNG